VVAVTSLEANSSLWVSCFLETIDKVVTLPPKFKFD